MRFPLTLAALAALVPFAHGQTRLGSFRAPEAARGWLDAPRDVLSELNLPGYAIRTAVDIDGDGRLELLAFRSAIQAPIVPVFNPAPDVFFAGEPLGTSRSNRLLGVGDLLGNGFPDFVTDDPSSVTGLTLHRNLGGAYAAPVTTPAPGQEPSLGAMGQADLDAARELLVVSFDRGSQFWARWWEIVDSALVPGPLLSLGTQVTAAAAIDVDGDGRDEVLFALGYPDEVRVASAGAGLALSVDQVLSVGASNPLFDDYSLATGDLDGDGDEDAVVTWLDDFSLSVYGLQVLENTGAQLVARPAQLTADPATNAVLADWDKDGDLDLLGARFAYGQAENVGGLTFRPAGSLACPFSTIVAVADVNEDGYHDVVTPRGTKHGDGTFEDTGRALVPTLGTARPIDVDGDGDLDVLERTWLAYLNDGTGRFASTPIDDLLVPPLPPPTSELRAAGDLDGDGELDLLGWAPGMGGGFTEVLLRGVGGGRFAYAGPAAPANVAITDFNSIEYAPADLDGDGDLDLLSTMGWAENDGTGYFGTVHPAWSDQPLATADVDRDGDLDVAVRESFAATLYRNDGAGSFSSEPLAPSSFGIAMWRDLDDDGWPELVTSGFSSTIEIVPNVAGAFPGPPLALPAMEKSFVEVADFDGDGLLDVLGTKRGNSLSSETTSIFRQSGGPALAFDAPRLFTTQVGAVVSGDFDGDRDVDLLRSRMVKSWRRHPFEKASRLPARQR